MPDDLPATGGSYIRNPRTGGLVVAEAPAATVDTDPAPAPSEAVPALDQATDTKESK